MRRGLIGARLGHSYSAGLHRTLGGYPYELIEVDETQLAAMMKKKDFSALNVTIPYKQTVIPWLDELDERARRIGAVNTITNDHGHLKGWNTDAAGFEMMLKQAGMDVGGRKVIVLGNGGAAQAVIAVLEELGAGQIIRVKQRPSAQTLTYPQAYQLHGDAQVLINTSPVGMAPDYQGCPVDLDRFAQLESVADVIYNPHRTRLLLKAQQRGLRTAGGLIMLVAQAAEAIRLFDGKLVGQDQILSATADLARSTLNLVLVGMPGCGKSTLARQLAKLSGRPAVDLDQNIVERTGMPIRTFFDRYGETAFREVEAEILAEACSGSGQIIATGGGVVKSQENIERLRQSGGVFFVHRDLDQLQADESRPLSRSQSDLQRLYRERIALYHQAADFHISNNTTVQQCAQQIWSQWQRHADLFINAGIQKGDSQ